MNLVMRGNKMRVVVPGGCDKMAFRSRAKAKKKAIKSVCNLYPYQCPRCGRWHLTTMKQG